jgi:hypothetical protein
MTLVTCYLQGANTITFSRAAQAGTNNTGMGYDTVLLEVQVRVCAAAPTPQ